MRQICLPGTQLCVSRFIFGTATLHHLGGIPVQVAHLERAAATGFTHFDTAPLYGFGGAELAIGRAFDSNAAITVTTKVGLYPPGGLTQSRTEMLARKAAGKVWPPLSRAVADYAVAKARHSLESSLFRLRRRHVDLLLVHEPVPDLLKSDEWQRWLETEAERVRYTGVAGSSAHVAAFCASVGPLGGVIQVRDGLNTLEADVVTAEGRPLQLTYGYLSTGVTNINVDEILAGALARNRTGAVLVSTRRRERLAEFSAAAAREAR